MNTRAKGFASMQGRVSGLVVALALLLGGFDCLEGAESAEAWNSKLRRYPYLTDVVGSSATINWATDRSSTTSVVKWGKVENGSCTASSKTATRTSITVASEDQYQWKVRLTLSADTEYCYRIYLGSNPQEDLLGSDPSPRFFSQLPAASSEPYSFVVFGNWGQVDASGANPQQANLMQQIAASGARFALTTGDNAYNSGTQTNYGDVVHTGADTSAVFGPAFWKVPGASLPLFPALGNHGISTASTHFTNWPQAQAVASSGGRYVNETHCCLNGTTSKKYGSAWYAFDAGNARFYVLQAAWADTNVGTASVHQNDYDHHWAPGAPEREWLENDLAAHPSQLKFAFFQYPLYSDNKQKHSDTFLQGADSLEGLLSRNGVDIAFSGDAHLYQRNLKAHADSLVTYVTGGGGSKLAPIGEVGCSPFDAYGIGWSNSSNGGLGNGSACGAALKPTSKDEVFHFLKVTVDGAQVTVTPINSLGQSFDQATYDFGRSADISVAMSDLPDPVPAWQTLTYTATVRNDGPSAASGATFAEKLPLGASYVSATPSQGSCSHSLGKVTCMLGELASGATATVDVAVEPQREGTIAATATAHAKEFDPDTANNAVAEESTVELPTGVLAFTPSDDAHVSSDATSSNFGSRTVLEIDNSPAKHLLMRFAVSGVGAGNVVSASLRIYCIGGSGRSGGNFYGASDNGWLESTVTWATAPPIGTVLLDSLGGVAPGHWYELDVTPLVTGDGLYSLRVTSSSVDGAEYSSKEDPLGLVPQLVVTTG